MDDACLTVAIKCCEALLHVLRFEIVLEREGRAALCKGLVHQGENLKNDSLSWFGYVDVGDVDLERENSLDEKEVHDVWWYAAEECDVVLVSSERMAIGAEEVLLFVRVGLEERCVHTKRYAFRLHQAHLRGILHKFRLESEFQCELLDRVILEAEAVSEEELVILLGSIIVEELLTFFEDCALKAAESERLVRFEVPFYSGGNGVV